MMSYRSLSAWLAVGAVAASLASALATAAPAVSQSQDETFGLPDGKGRDTVMSYCAACHSLKLVSQQKLPRYVWEELLETMNKRHGMPKLPPEDEKVVLDYLAQQLAPPPRRRKF